ncbi:hypothetical protein [Streptacidiphilus anmyonensis]|uniref:hypothetical protein n=1 Tax=Streptacidiphilus anmyonensis TaxID=405782 RepID=UPI0005A8AFA2|nr:hypothetical protein [Streptacidiphilus anmyonensis]
MSTETQWLVLPHEGEPTEELRVVATEGAGEQADAVVSRLLRHLSQEDRLRVRGLEPALKLVALAAPDLRTWLLAVRPILEPVVAPRPKTWWESEILRPVLDEPVAAPAEPASEDRSGRAERRARAIQRIREENAETLERLAEL